MTSVSIDWQNQGTPCGRAMYWVGFTDPTRPIPTRRGEPKKLLRSPKSRLLSRMLSSSKSHERSYFKNVPLLAFSAGYLIDMQNDMGKVTARIKVENWLDAELLAIGARKEAPRT